MAPIGSTRSGNIKTNYLIPAMIAILVLWIVSPLPSEGGKDKGNNTSSIQLTQNAARGEKTSILIKDPVSFSAQNIIDPMKGTVDFWVQPGWNGDNINGEKALFYVNFNANHSILVSVYAVPPFARFVKIELYNTAIPGYHWIRVYSGNAPIVSWKAGQRHKIQVFWDFTLPEGQQYITGKVDDHYFQFNGHAPQQQLALIQGQSLAPNAMIYIGQQPFNKNIHNANAVISQLSIFKESHLPVIPFPKSIYNPAKPETEVPIRKLYANDGFCSSFENHNQVPNDCLKLKDDIKSGEDVMFFQKPAFATVFEGTVPRESEIKADMEYQATPGEYTDLFFNVYSRKPLSNVLLTYTPFIAANGHTIPKTNLDLRIVRNWFQWGDGLPRYVPELLVHDDQIPLETVPSTSPAYLFNGSWFIPSMPIHDYVKGKIAPNTSKQLVMIAKVPDNTPPGIYTANVRLKADNLSEKTLKLILEVLPFSLRETGKKYGINYSTTSLDVYCPKLGLHWESEVRKQLKDIREHGFTDLVIYGWDTEKLAKSEKLLKLAKEFGFNDAIIYIPTSPGNLRQKITPKLKNLIVSYGYQPYFWGVDEVGLNYKLKEHIEKSRWIHSIGGKVVANCGKDLVDALDNPDSQVYKSFSAGTYEPIDFPIVNVTSGATGHYFQDLLSGKVNKNSQKLCSFYWQCNQEDPRINRRGAGYHLMLTQLDGVFPHMYMAAAMDCYNEFRRGFSQSYVVYPSREGPVPTMEWEALRAGINDGRYLATWKYYKEKVAKSNPSLAQASEVVVEGILKHYRYANMDINAVPIDISQFDHDRQTIIHEIKKLIDSIKGN